MAEIKDIVIDCMHAAPLALFWAQVLDGYDVAPYDDAEIARLAALGLTPETDPVVMVEGAGHRLCFQEVPEPKIAKNRVHLDLVSTDRRSEVERLVGLGATIYQEGDRITTLQDPEGNEFCIADP